MARSVSLRCRKRITRRRKKDLEQAVSWESQPNIADIYPLATAALEAKPVNPAGFWYIVEAAMLAQGTGQQQILSYGKSKYTRYHGSDQGWDDLVNQVRASTSVTPPAGFTVTQYVPPSPAQQAADLVSKTPPTQMSFAGVGTGVIFRQSAGCRHGLDGHQKQGGQAASQRHQRYLHAVQLAGSDDDIQANKVDITLEMTKPIPSRLMPQVGSMMAFQGTLTSYTPTPFMMTMTDGILLDKNGKPLSEAPVGRRPRK